MSNHPLTDVVWNESAKMSGADSECYLRKHAERMETGRSEMLEALEAITPPKPLGSDWWCPSCKELIDGGNVTNNEHCDRCGTFLGDCQPNEFVVNQAHRAIAKAKAKGESAT